MGAEQSKRAVENLDGDPPRLKCAQPPYTDGGFQPSVGLRNGSAQHFTSPRTHHDKRGQDLSLGFSPKRILHSPTYPARRETRDRSRKINKRERKSRDRFNQPSVAGIYG